MLSVVIAICVSRLLIQLRFRNVVCRYQSLIEDQANGYADRKCASTKAKSEDFVIGRTVVTASKLIERDHVSTQTYSECATKDSERLEGRSSHAVIIARNLIVFCQIKRAKHSPNVC